MALGITQCSEKLGYLILQLGKNFLVFMVMVIACNGLHFLLKRYSQPRITTDIIVGLIMGNIPFLRKLYDEFNSTFGFIIDFGMMCYMFALGIEMDPCVFFIRPTKDAQVAYAGIFCTFVISCAMTPFLHYFSSQHGIAFVISVSALLSSTASPVLTRLITNHKIGKSDIGKLVIAAGMHSDFVCSLLLALSYIFMSEDSYCIGPANKTVTRMITMLCAVLGQTLFTAVVSPIFIAWVNNENPEGKPMKGSHLVLSLAFMVMICASSTLYNYSPVLSAFMTGICFPRDGRVSKWVISKINYLLAAFFFPIFFMWMGYAADITKVHFGDPSTWIKLFIPISIVVVGKIAGTLVAGAFLGFRWPDSIAIALLLVTKGHFQIYMAVKVINCGDTNASGLISVMTIFCTVVHAPVVVAHIIKRARKRAPTHTMALQMLDSSSELRILLCLHGPQNVPASINFMEISRGTANPGILVYVAEIIELTEQIAATVENENGEGIHTTAVRDKEVIEMREQVTNSFQAYVDKNAEGITLKRTLAVSTINNMAQNICVLADQLMIALIIVPFHRNQRQDGKLDGGHQGFRYVNRKLLKSAPCSVGILVNRGFGSFENITRTEVSMKVAAIFIGGKDDREALAYVGRVAWHPGVKVTVIRFLVDTSAESTRLAAYRVSLPQQEEEMGMDDECFAQFYEKHIVEGRMSYIEKHLANAAETFSTLRSFEGQYSLVVVGKEGGVNSILTKGMNDWQQCPELGPIGDVLSGPDFSTTVSVLIIQQHKIRGELDGLDEDFNIM